MGIQASIHEYKPFYTLKCMKHLKYVRYETNDLKPQKEISI